MKGLMKIQAVLLVLVLGAALGLGYVLGTRHPDHGATAPGAGQEQGKTQYTCSMHPFILRDAPGACPICGMALTPVKEAKDHEHASGQDEGTAAGEIRIDPVTLQNMGVKTEKVVKRSLQRTLRAVGLVGAAENRQHAVNAKIEGWVERLHINQQGQEVKKGQPLLEIYSPDLVAAQQEYLLAAANSKRLADSPFPEIAAGAGRLLEAARTRLRYWDISEAQIRTMAQTGQVRKTLTLYSEQDGVVTGKKVLQGARIMPGEELLQIVDLSTVWINAEIFEHEIQGLQVGQTVRVELPATGGQVIEGRITFIAPSLDNETRTVKARIEATNPGLQLKPGMYAQVQIHTSKVDQALAIPGTAMLSSGKEHTVFVALGEGRFAPRQVQTGIRDDDGAVQILAGLTEGEEVVVSAQFMLDSESRLREALDKMSGPKAPPGPTPGGTKADPKALEDLFK